MSSDGDGDGSEGPTELDRYTAHLYEVISRVKAFGSFATFNPISEFANPGISVEGVGLIRLPLSTDQAIGLIAVSQRAPFGHGGQTLTDLSVRKTWELDKSQVMFRNPKWSRCLGDIINQAAGQLGALKPSTFVHAEFYKMLLYERGAMFKPHKE